MAADHAGTAGPGAPRFGVNYTPRRGWFHSWVGFDHGEARSDLAQIAALGFDHVRVFHLWPLLQPNRGLIDPVAVAQLVRLCEIAAGHGLDVCVDAIQGHLSGFDFYPSWTQTWHSRNIFTDPDAIDAQARLVRELGVALDPVPNVFCLQLGNELNNMVAHNPATADQIDAYLDTLLAAASSTFSRWVTHSAYDAAWYSDDHPFTPEASAGKGDVTTVHPWVFSGNCARRYGPSSVAVRHLAEYGVELATAYAADAGRPVWVQECGAPEPHIPAEMAPDFAEATIRHVAGCADVWGITWWCSHDVDRSLLDFPELEYTLGVFSADGSVKPVGERIGRVIRELRSGAGAAGRAGGGAPGGAARRALGGAVGAAGGAARRALVLDCTHANRSVSGPGGAFFDAWMSRRAVGERAAIVLASRSGDAEYLARRGIERVEHPAGL